MWLSVYSPCNGRATCPGFYSVHAFISSCQVFGVGLFSYFSRSTMTWLQLVRAAAARFLTNTLADSTSPHDWPLIIGSQWNTDLISKSFLFHTRQQNLALTLHLRIYWVLTWPDGYYKLKKAISSDCTFTALTPTSGITSTFIRQQLTTIFIIN